MADIRQQRAQRGALRGDGGRDRRRTKGQFKQYYEDAGVSTTPEAYGQWKKGEEEYRSKVASERAKIKKAQGEYSSAKGSLSSMQSELDKAQSNIPGVREAIDKSWKKFEGSFVPVRVVDPSGTKVEAVYKLPKSAIASLQKDLGGFEQKYVEDGKFYNISTRHNKGPIRGQEIHDALSGASKDIKLGYYKQALPEATKAIGSAQSQFASEKSSAQSKLNQASSQLAGTGAKIDTAKSRLAQSESMHNEDIQRVRSEYQDKLNKMKEIFGGLSVGKGNKK